VRRCNVAVDDHQFPNGFLVLILFIFISQWFLVLLLLLLCFPSWTHPSFVLYPKFPFLVMRNVLNKQNSQELLCTFMLCVCVCVCVCISLCPSLPVLCSVLASFTHKCGAAATCVWISTMPGCSERPFVPSERAREGGREVQVSSHEHFVWAV
jgi:hypothetical protein